VQQQPSSDAAAYLERIGYRGPLTATADTLRQLQVAHLRSVPFENLSIHAGEAITLDDAALFAKVVNRRRGGFCYELNGLFAWLLRSLGFDVVMLAAEVRNARGDWGLPFDHMALLVRLEEPWLVDVGFGDSFLEPLKLDSRDVQVQGDQAFRIDRDGDRLLVVRRQGDQWVAQYRFTLQTHSYADYESMCRYHQTSPESPFTQRRVCSMATPDGRTTLSHMRLITTRGGDKQERELADRAEYDAALRTHFGVVM
jgi:N-hydroxyarylamine O-acetyltransferase